MASLHPWHALMVVLYVAVDIIKQMTELRSGRCINILGNISADRDRDLVTECLSIVIHLTDIMGRISERLKCPLTMLPFFLFGVNIEKNSRQSMLNRMYKAAKKRLL